MLFHITQTHTPETCPKDEGGSKVLYNPKADGVKSAKSRSHGNDPAGHKPGVG